MKLNYESEHYKNDTIIPNPCATQPLREATLADIARSNSAGLDTLYYTVNKLYTHLYGDTIPHNTEGNAEPTCLWDEVANQARTLLLINEKLALICAKLGV